MMALESLTWAFWIVWYSIKEQGFKSQNLGSKHGIFYDFLPNMIHLQICTKFYQGKHSDQVS